MKQQSNYVIWEQFGDVMNKMGEVPNAYMERLRDIVKDCDDQVHGNSEQVYVLEVDQTVYAAHLAPNGKAKPLEGNETFPSARAASTHLGYGHNEVCQALSRDKTAREDEAIREYGPNHTMCIRPEATLRGVRLQYARDWRG